ncbi:hypothetical protein CU044_0491 [Streptomyces sp. L-9-10]|nr:hypothetical protein CU044_0491 [Streptomyces sp. L-9-10]
MTRFYLELECLDRHVARIPSPITRQRQCSGPAHMVSSRRGAHRGSGESGGGQGAGASGNMGEVHRAEDLQAAQSSPVIMRARPRPPALGGVGSRRGDEPLSAVCRRRHRRSNHPTGERSRPAGKRVHPLSATSGLNRVVTDEARPDSVPPDDAASFPLHAPCGSRSVRRRFP